MMTVAKVYRVSRTADRPNHPPSAIRHWLLLALIVLSACARRAPSPPPAPNQEPATGLRVTLTWVGAADLDLYVTGPSWETVYFGNTPGRSGGTLERDARCRDAIAEKASAPMVEWTTFSDPAPGGYRVGVDYLEGCGGPTDPQPFRVVVEYADARHERTGIVRHHEFDPIVLEFALHQPHDNGPPALVLERRPEVQP
jgi:hypothetical protein